MSRIYNGTTLGAPRLAHTMTEGAEQARAAVRRHAVKKKADALVTKLPRRVDLDLKHPIPTGAQRLYDLAVALGYEVKIVHGYTKMNAGKVNETEVPAVMVGGKSNRRGLGFRCMWVRGKAYSGILYERGTGHPFGRSIGVTAVYERIER